MMTRLLLFLGVLVLPVHSWAAAISTNATGTLLSHTVATSSPVSYTSLTIAAGSDRALVCVVSSRDGALPSVAMTWNSVSMTLSNSQQQDTWTEYAYIFTLLAPDTGNQTASLSWTGGGTFRLSMMCWAADNVGSISGSLTNSSGATANPQGNITTASGDATVSILTHSGGPTAHSHTTLFMDSVHGSAQYNLSTTSSDTHQYTMTATNWGLAGIRLLQTSAAVNFFPRRLQVNP